MPWLGAASVTTGATGLHEVLRECCGVFWSTMSSSVLRRQGVAGREVASVMAKVLAPVGVECAKAIKTIFTSPDQVDRSSNSSRRSSD